MARVTGGYDRIEKYRGSSLSNRSDVSPGGGRWFPTRGEAGSPLQSPKYYLKKEQKIFANGNTSSQFFFFWVSGQIDTLFFFFFSSKQLMASIKAQARKVVCIGRNYACVFFFLSHLHIALPIFLMLSLLLLEQQASSLPLHIKLKETS